MTPSELKTARKQLGLTQAGLADLLRLAPNNGGRAVRAWEAGARPIPGPVSLAIELLTNGLKIR